MSSSESESTQSSCSLSIESLDLESDGEDSSTQESQDAVGRAPTVEEPYHDEPLADEQFLEEYEQEMTDRTIRKAILDRRFEGLVPISQWCKCGKCSLQHIENSEELNCCHEIDGCKEALTSDLVLADIEDDAQLNCITEHPGFSPVCLQKWSLRMAAAKFKTTANRRYRQTGIHEEKFLRSVAYREFTRLVHGIIGRKRIPLPACAYFAIRTKFKTRDESFTGYEDEELQQ